MNRKIADRYFNELKNGHTVPRNEKTGNTLVFTVGKVYKIKNERTNETVNAKCTQDCPCALVLISTN